MASKQDLSDEYVAEALKQDARDSSIKYSTLGLEALLPKRPTIAAPKPNTRFLQSILRETDNHNAALKVKELGDAARRLRELRGEGPKGRRQVCYQEQAEFNEDYRRKRRRIEESGDQHESRSKDRSVPRSRRRDDDDRTGRRRRRRSASSGSEESVYERRHRRHHRAERHRSRSREKRKVGSRSRSPRRYSRERGGDREKRRRRRDSSSELDIDNAVTRARRKANPHKDSRVPLRNGSPPGSAKHRTFVPDKAQRRETRTAKQSDEESDPLEAIVGPAPPPTLPKVHARGRGALAASSGIDSRFSTSYNPSTDVQLNDDSDDDWDQALEALRDRQRWKQQGADRLLAAGFTQEEIKKWEDGSEKRDEDVIWKKSGEGREWDRGKVVDVDGQVVLEPPEWGRLKGTD